MTKNIFKTFNKNLNSLLPIGFNKVNNDENDNSIKDPQLKMNNIGNIRLRRID